MTQDRREMERVMFEIERCRLDLVDLGYTEFTYEDYFSVSFLLYLYFIYCCYYFSSVVLVLKASYLF